MDGCLSYSMTLFRTLIWYPNSTLGVVRIFFSSQKLLVFPGKSIFPLVYADTTNSEKAMAPHSSTLAWKIPWVEPGGLQSMGLLRVRHDWVTSLSLSTFMYWRRKWQTHSSVLAWRIPGTGQPGGLPSLGSHRVGHNWGDLAAVAAAIWKILKNKTFKT